MGNISKNTRGATRKDLPAKEKRHRRYGTNMDTTNGKMGHGKEKENTEYGHKNRTVLQKEINDREKDLEKQQKWRKQRELLMAWGDAADYLGENQSNIKYSRTPIIDINKQEYTGHQESRNK